jgi:hypothetical protein
LDTRFQIPSNFNIFNLHLALQPINVIHQPSLLVGLLLLQFLELIRYLGLGALDFTYMLKAADSLLELLALVVAHGHALALDVNLVDDERDQLVDHFAGLNLKSEQVQLYRVLDPPGGHRTWLSSLLCPFVLL